MCKMVNPVIISPSIGSTWRSLLCTLCFLSIKRSCFLVF
jgi:hypothetical protein